MRKRVWSFAIALCAALCVALGASAGVASAQHYVKVGFYMLAGDEQRPVTGYNVVMDVDGIDIWSEGDITYYHVLGGRVIGRVGEGVEPHLYQGLYDFQYNAKTGEYRCIYLSKPPGEDFAYDYRDRNLVPIERANDSGAAFVTSPDMTPKVVARKLGARKYSTMTYTGEAAYVLRALLAHQKGEKITLIDEGMIP